MTGSPAGQVDCVIPTHGRPDFLAEALASVARQTVSVGTVVVVSDDGDERTRDVVAGIAQDHPGLDVRLVDRSTGPPGASASRNEGARHGRAPLLAFLDDDDAWEPGYLGRAQRLLSDSGADAVVTPLQRFSSTGPGAVVVPEPGLTARDVFRRSPGVTGSSIVLRRPVFAGLGGFDEELPVQNDRDFFLRLLTAGHGYVVGDQPLVRVRDHGQGRLTDASAMRADGIRRFLDKHGADYGRGDRRRIAYLSHRTRMSSASSRRELAGSTVAALATWSPAAGRQIPLDLFRRDRWRAGVGRILGSVPSPRP